MEPSHRKEENDTCDTDEAVEKEGCHKSSDHENLNLRPQTLCDHKKFRSHCLIGVTAINQLPMNIA